MGRAAERPSCADCAVATIGDGAAEGRQQGIPHAPGCAQWQHAPGQVPNASNGCTCTAAAQKTARSARTRRFMGRAGSWGSERSEQFIFPKFGWLGAPYDYVIRRQTIAELSPGFEPLPIKWGA